MTKLEQKIKDGWKIEIRYFNGKFEAELLERVYNSSDLWIPNICVESKISTLNALFFLEQKLEGEVS